MGFGFVVERFGLFLQLVAKQPLATTQRSFSLWLGIALLLLGALANIVSSIQFRRVTRSLGPEEIPIGYWTDVGVWMNLALAGIALVLVLYFVWSA